MDKVFVVIAAYNEASVIAQTIANLREYVKHIIVVDDYSADATAENAYHAGAYVLQHVINLGQGSALQTGIEYALTQGAQYIVTFDADGQHDATEILPMLLALKESQADIALGNRFMGKTQGMPLQRRIVLKLAVLFTQITTGIKLTDAHNGFRVMTRQFCESFQFRQNRMAHASEILNYIGREKAKYIEFPVTITYTEYSLLKGQKSSNGLRVLMELLMGYVSKWS